MSFVTWRHSSLTITQFNGNTALLVSKTEEAGQIFFYISSAFRFTPWAEIQNESCAIVTSDFKFQMYVFKSQTYLVISKQTPTLTDTDTKEE